MKKLMIYSALCGMAFTSCYHSKSENSSTWNSFTSSKQGEGDLIDKTYEFNFDGIAVSTGINTEIVKSDQEKVVITAPSDIMDRILVEKDGNMLKVRIKPNSNISTKRIKAVIYAKDFTSVMASSSADIVIKDTFTQDHVSVQCSSSGDISGNLEANEVSIMASSSGDFSGKIWAVLLNATASSSGDINISGKATESNITCSSSGDFNGEKFFTKSANLMASSSADIVINVEEKANAQASSGAGILVYNKGNATINRSTSSGGSVDVRQVSYQNSSSKIK